MASSSRGKGRSDSFSKKPSDWSEWVWDQRGYWVTSRYGAAGEVEYDYRYPGNEHNAQNQQTTPRSPGPNALTSSDGDSRLDSASLSTYNSDATAAYTIASTTQASYGNYSAAYSPTYLSPTFTQPNDQTQGHPGASFNTSVYPTTAAEGSTSQAPRVQYSVDHVTNALGGLGFNSPSTREDASIPTNYETYPQNDQSIDPTCPSDGSNLDPRYRVIETKNQKKFFKVGRVFLARWTEPARDAKGVKQKQGDGIISNASHFSPTYLGGTAFTEIRRYVIVQEGYGNSICCPIHTYGGKATLKPNLPDAQQHAIIYTSDVPPDEYWYKADDGSIVSEQLRKDPIKVISEQFGPEGDLGHLSRINYSKLYTIEHYNKVLNIGMVDPRWLETLASNSIVRRNTPPERPKNHPRGSSAKKSGRKDDDADRGGSGKFGRETDRKHDDADRGGSGKSGRETDRKHDDADRGGSRKSGKETDRKHKHGNRA